MELPKIVIADSEIRFCQELTEALTGIYRVRSCSDGREAQALLAAFAPDVLVVDLMLPGRDGLTLLQSAAQKRNRPKVLATMRFTSDYIEDTLSRFGVSYIMRKPCDVEAVAARLRDLTAIRPRGVEPVDPRVTVTNLLIALGISPKRRGYACLREAILLMAARPGQSITKELYPAVGKLCDANKFQVERVIRLAIDEAWSYRRDEIWARYFPGASDGESLRPTNAVFINRLADCLTLGLQETGFADPEETPAAVCPLAQAVTEEKV